MITEEHGTEYNAQEEFRAKCRRNKTAASPFCIASCLTAVLAIGLLGFSAYMAVASAGDIPDFYAMAGFFALPVTILGVWLGMTGKNERKEKRQKTGTVGCVANALLFLLLSCIYGSGLM